MEPDGGIGGQAGGERTARADHQELGVGHGRRGQGAGYDLGPDAAWIAERDADPRRSRGPIHSLTST
jgi:hypothetical protein